MDVKSIGAAVDIGTSYVTIRLIDLKSNERIKEWRFLNPQQSIGPEVISRVRYAQVPTMSRQMTSMIREVISSQLVDALNAAGIVFSSLTSIVIVGNTVMHHLFFDLPVDSLTKFPYKAQNKTAFYVSGDALGFSCFSNAEIYSPPIVESYIGSDAMMLLLVSGMLQESTSSVAVDVGTNTEIIVEHDDSLWIASAASGPAFEGMSLECGMLAIDGAITSIQIDSLGRPSVRTLGTGRPRGICGSGAVSALARLLDSGFVNKSGSLVTNRQSPWALGSKDAARYILVQATESDTGKPVYLSQIDLRQIQLSKAAICAATELLLKRAGCSPDFVKHFFLTGTFGSRLNVEDAFRIGLFPRMSRASVDQMEGGAVMGASRLLSECNLRDVIEEASHRLRYLELIDDHQFHRLHAEAQFFPDA